MRHNYITGIISQTFSIMIIERAFFLNCTHAVAGLTVE